MRFYRTDGMDDLPTPDPVYRSDTLREHVDRLPAKQKHIIERLYFGGADLLTVAAEIGISRKHARDLRDKAFATLQAKVLEDVALGQMLPASVGAVGNRSLPVA